MVTLPNNKMLVSLLVVVCFGWFGQYLLNWLLKNDVAREIILSTLIFAAAAVVIGYEAYSRFSQWQEDRQTRPGRNSK